ncbi:MAG: ribosome maturation factor RimM [Thermoleophilia bacterium]|jgi:16S rRNA processing protein RimM
MDADGGETSLKGAPDWVLVGMVKRIHGREGEMLIMPLTDRSDRFEAGAELYLARKRRQERLPVRITAMRRSDRGPLVRIEGYDSQEKAQELFGASLFVPGAEVAPVGEDAFFAFQLEGLEVYAGGERVGSVSAVHESRKANPYLEIDPGGDSETVYIPFVRQVVLSIDLEAGRIEIPEGFLG